jgi:hypothetical protein
LRRGCGRLGLDARGVRIMGLDNTGKLRGRRRRRRSRLDAGPFERPDVDFGTRFVVVLRAQGAFEDISIRFWDCCKFFGGDYEWLVRSERHSGWRQREAGIQGSRLDLG